MILLLDSPIVTLKHVVKLDSRALRKHNANYSRRIPDQTSVTSTDDGLLRMSDRFSLSHFCRLRSVYHHELHELSWEVVPKQN